MRTGIALRCASPSSLQLTSSDCEAGGTGPPGKEKGRIANQQYVHISTRLRAPTLVCDLYSGVQRCGITGGEAESERAGQKAQAQGHGQSADTPAVTQSKLRTSQAISKRRGFCTSRFAISAALACTTGKGGESQPTYSALTVKAERASD